jgi:hypothetical protein
MARKTKKAKDAITTAERKLFEALTSGEFSNFALVRARFRGTPAAVISAVNRDGESVIVSPVALLLRDEDMNDLLGPDGEPLGNDLVAGKPGG